MTDEQKEEILNSIRKTHGIATTEKDPIFSLLTISEIVFSEYMKKIDLMFTQHEANVETTTEKYLSKVKELAEVKITTATNSTLEQLEQFKIEAKQDLVNARDDPSSSSQIPMIYWVLLAMTGAVGYLIALLILT